ncbi:MAG: hypothetical protein LBD97_09585, partial [Bifidobacteriaceae bacterium]|nr:hypothetical protein [Bifidobacteriaceae bacterium]
VEPEDFAVFRGPGQQAATSYTVEGREALTDEEIQFYVTAGEAADSGLPVLVVDDFDYSEPYRACLAEAGDPVDVRLPQRAASSS